MSEDMGDQMDVDQRRDGSLGVSMSEEGMGNPKEALRPRDLFSHLTIRPTPQNPGYSMGGTSDYPSFNPLPHTDAIPTILPTISTVPSVPTSTILSKSSKPYLRGCCTSTTTSTYMPRYTDTSA
ncbi:hypothetical protein MANES_S029116v8 [Manihot esculenta]|uniref:Uncharacterized protein n=1 Tax=Manihot esculenta TaxID=3983 RepID=A0ACB7FVR3_MANES|nr:hypothetical protein MANES_S029116v8 [Manihot esculenta]